MSGPEAALAFMVFGGGFWVLRPVAAAVAKRIAGEHRRPDEAGEDRDAILGELQQLRDDMTDLQERVDFAERMLAKQREADRLAPPT